MRKIIYLRPGRSNASAIPFRLKSMDWRNVWQHRDWWKSKEQGMVLSNKCLVQVSISSIITHKRSLRTNELTNLF